MGSAWTLIEEYREAHEPFPPSYRRLAVAVGVAPGTFNAWAEPQRLPARENIEALAKLLGMPYKRILEAFLRDVDYLP